MASVIGPPALDSAVAEVKALLRLEGEAGDALVGRLVASATALCEAFTGQWLLAREGSQAMPANGQWQRLAASPVVAVIGVDAWAEGGEPVPLASDAYATDIDADGDGWIRVSDAGGARRVRARFEAGMAETWDGLPEALRHGVLRLAAYLYSQREAGAAPAEPPAAVTALWRPWRRMRLR